MDLSRQEYPALLNGLQPSQAVALVNERVEYIAKLNYSIAEWLEDRRKVEEAYASGMRKLARKKLQDETMGLGAFTAAWQTITNSAEEIALSHHTLARSIERDVEKPLRGFNNSNREMQSMSTIQGNLASMAKEAEGALKKSGRGRTGSTEGAMGQWNSQAPYIMEQLQAADESRCNHLRDVLTQYQTHEIDQVERNRVTAEQCLNVLLTVETADEIKLFAVRNVRDTDAPTPMPTLPAAGTPQRGSRMPPRTDTESSLRVPQALQYQDDRASQRSASVHEEKEEKKGRFGGLKRLGTVLKGKRSSIQTTPSKNRKEAMRTESPAFSPQPPIREDDSAVSTPTREAINRLGHSNERDLPAAPLEPVASPAPTNGARAELAGLQEPLQPSQGSSAQQPQQWHGAESSQSIPFQSQQNNPYNSQPQQTFPAPPRSDSYEAPSGAPRSKAIITDGEGYSTPSAAFDPISQAERDANESASRQYDVDIRNAPIAEEDETAGAAITDLASTLRAQAGPQRRSTTRGRRDVRNTMYMPSSPLGDNFTEQQPPLPSMPQQQAYAPAMSNGSSNIMMTPFLSSLAGGQPPTAAQRAFPGIERTESDTTSIRSGRSSVAGGDALSKHADMGHQGLNVSMVETISAWFEQGSVTRATVIGEMALAHNAGNFPSTSNSESIRIDNFAALEKVAPNPAFITQQGGQGGEYSVNLTNISHGPQIAFKYQVHVDPSTASSYAPIILSPMWRIQPTQTSVILSYSLNPAIASSLSGPIHISNVVLSIAMDISDPSAGKPSACQSKPAGTFSRERGAITWRLGDITLAPGAAPEKLLARFVTDTQGKQGRVEAKWEIGSASESLGSGLGVSVMESRGAFEADPFADDDPSASSGNVGNWKKVIAGRRLVSGTYLAM